MIKKGDKVVCKKSCYFTENDWESVALFTITYTAGKAYEVVAVESYYKDITFLFIMSDSDKPGLRFAITRSELRFKQFNDYFYNEAEWRDKQIDSILND